MFLHAFLFVIFSNFYLLGGRFDRPLLLIALRRVLPEKSLRRSFRRVIEKRRVFIRRFWRKNSYEIRKVRNWIDPW